MQDEAPRIQLASIRLDGAHFDGASLGGFAFRGVSLRSASLRHCDLRDCDLSGADLHDTDLTGALVDSSTVWPEAFDWKRAGVLDTSRFETLDGARFSGSFFYGSDFEDLSVSHASFEPSAFYDVRFHNCVFLGVDFRNCIFEACEMRDCKFGGCDFSESSLFETRIINTTFSDSVFTSAFLTTDTLCDQGLEEFMERGAVLIGPGCDLSGLTLFRRFFPREGLRGARLLRADLRGSGLSLHQLQECDLRFCIAGEELLEQPETADLEEADENNEFDATGAGDGVGEVAQGNQLASDGELEAQHTGFDQDAAMDEGERAEKVAEYAATHDRRRILSIVSRLRSFLDHETERDLDRWLETDGWWTS